MATSRLGANLRSARERVGWSREALAYHSGLSWSAIAQMESGRRKEVRVSSLMALATALGVSVDYLVGGSATISPRLLGHSALIYGSEEGYLASALPFLVDGISRSEAVMAVPSKRQGDLLRDALGDDTRHVEFRDASEWYRALDSASSGYMAFAMERFARGAPWIRILGDAVWAGRSKAESAEWFRYEETINLAFASAPASILCSYDGRSLPDAVLAHARRTHPDAGDSTTGPALRGPEDSMLSPG